MAKFKLRDVVRLNGIQRTVEQIAEDPKCEPRYWLQRGTDFATRVWAKEHEIEAPGAQTAVALQFQRELVASRLPFVRKIGAVPAPCEPQVIREGTHEPSFVRRGLAPGCE